MQISMSNSGTQSPLVTSQHYYSSFLCLSVSWLHCGEGMEALHHEDMVSCQEQLSGKPQNHQAKKKEGVY